MSEQSDFADLCWEEGEVTSELCKEEPVKERKRGNGRFLENEPVSKKAAPGYWRCDFLSKS